MNYSVRIYKPSKNAMQSGLAKTKKWVMEPDICAPSLPEHLMGWQSCDDTFKQVRLYFPSEQEALKFAQSKGWHATVQAEKIKAVKPRNYTDNFKA
ncbi:MAG: oxidoreductase [Micavibrio sp.]|nr:oxidoreductase [Micavibrio sp.]HCK32264.1 oxidoreductase [Rhodospirillaceae bacterium]|tara:strand:- start:348 stop:635 length:288 start_codon:yes stop_codon:yes gene_type:complete